MRTRHLLALSCAALLTSACSSTPKPGGDPDDFDVPRMLAREADPVALLELQGPNASFRASAPARLVGEMRTLEGYYEWSLDIGSEYPVACWLYPTGIDLATGLSKLASAILEEQEALGAIEAKQITAVEAGAIDGNPYMAVQWLYRVQQESGSALGQVTILTSSKWNAGLACAQNELGYEATLQRAFEQLVRTLELPDLPVAPYYAEISTMSLRGQKVGIQRLEFTLDEDGDTRISTTTAMAVPTSATDLMVSDAYDIQFSTQEGQLINQWIQSVDAGSISMELSLGGGGDEDWVVDGIYEHKEITTSIPREPLESLLGQMQSLRGLVATGKPGDTLSTRSWVANADPTRFIDSTAHFVERVDDKAARVEIRIGPFIINGITDRNGSITSGEMKMGPVVFEVERVHHLGEL